MTEIFNAHEAKSRSINKESAEMTDYHIKNINEKIRSTVSNQKMSCEYEYGSHCFDYDKIKSYYIQRGYSVGIRNGRSYGRDIITLVWS